MPDTETLMTDPAADEAAREAELADLRQSLAVDTVGDETSPLTVEQDEEALAAIHKGFTGKHSHPHSTYGSQGGDSSHEHFHSHAGSSSHNHHAAAVSASVLARLGETERRRRDGANEVTDPEQLSAMVASALSERGIEPVIAATTANGTVIGSPWHAYLCVEGIRTDDDRELLLDSSMFPDLPIALRYLIEDSGGHWGAVTCGRIDSMERQLLGTPPAAIYAEGVFGTDPNGQLAELMVTEQTQRFVSIDPRDVVGEIISVVISVGDGDCDWDDDCFVDEWMRISSYTIGAATVVPIPAYPQAVITLASEPLPEAPIANASAPPSISTPMLVSAGGPVVPKLGWFANPNFYLGDPRLIRQPQGGAACPSTVSEDGTHCWGHLASWETTHTAGLRDERGRPRTPPRSRTNYANFLTGHVITDDGTVVPVGNLTFGTGHASTRHGTTLAEVISHYDGGYGCVVMADIVCGDDDYGIWFAGAMRPDLTDEQLRAFRATNLSGDWRDLGGNLELVAVLAGVPSPGFPIARRAMTAAGTPAYQDGEATIATMEGERCVALVAAGRVMRIDPMVRLASMEREVDALRAQIHGLAIDRVRDRL